LASRIFTRVAPLALLLAACGDAPPAIPPPDDAFYFPTGLALRHVPPGCTGGSLGCTTQLIVGSSNFDLRYDPVLGGRITSVDVKTAVELALARQLADSLSEPPALDASNGLLGTVRVGSFGGEVAVLDEETCPGWETTLRKRPQALVASRSQNALYRVDLEGFSDALRSPLDASLADPYGVTVACGKFPTIEAPLAKPVAQALAFVTYLRAPNTHGWLSRIDLTDNTLTAIDVGTVPTHSAVFDPASTRLYATSRFGAIGYSPLRWLTLATPSAVPIAVNVFDVVRGAELRGIALSSDGTATTSPTRAYLALRIYDVAAATSSGTRPGNDLAGALAVMDLSETSAGRPSTKILNVVPLDRGATEVRVIPRTGLRDLVAVTSTDDSTLTLYDDETGSIAKVFAVCSAVPGAGDPSAPAPCQDGRPLLGKQPFGLAAERFTDGTRELARLYVGSFDRGWVNVITIDPLLPSAAPDSWARIGPERPQ